jgi:hypothetical protein
VRGRRTRAAPGTGTAWAPGREVAYHGRGGARRVPLPNSSRRFASTRANAWPEAERGRVSTFVTAPGTWPWPRPPTRRCRASASSSRPSSNATTCPPRSPAGCARTPGARSGPQWRCGSCGCGAGTSARARGCSTPRSPPIARRRRSGHAGSWPRPRSTRDWRDRSTPSPAEEARRIHVELGSRAVAGALLYRGVLESVRRRYAAARDTLEAAFAQAQRVGESLVAAEARHAQGVEAHCRGRNDEARRLIEQGLELLPAPTDPRASVLGHDHRPRNRAREARAAAHVLPGHSCPVSQGRPRGGEGLHAVRLRPGRARPG